MCQIQVRQARDSLSRAGEADYTISQSAIARVGMVRSTERPGFMLTPKGAVGKRVEFMEGKWERTYGEESSGRLIWGSEGISGHPLWSSFGLDMATATKLRVLRECASCSSFPPSSCSASFLPSLLSLD